MPDYNEIIADTGQSVGDLLASENDRLLRLSIIWRTALQDAADELERMNGTTAMEDMRKVEAVIARLRATANG